MMFWMSTQNLRCEQGALIHTSLFKFILSGSSNDEKNSTEWKLISSATYVSKFED